MLYFVINISDIICPSFVFGLLSLKVMYSFVVLIIFYSIYAHPGNVILNLLTQNISNIDGETFALYINDYVSSNDALFSAFKSHDGILEILNTQNGIYGQYPNIKGDKCQLLLHNVSFRAKDDYLQQFFTEIFFDIVKYSRIKYDIQFELTRYDFFHGHLWYNNQTNIAGILYHANEYPYDYYYPYLGYCQYNSTLYYNPYYFSFRNILLIINSSNYMTLWLLNTSDNSYITNNIMQEYAITLFDTDFGESIGQIYYFNDTSLLWQLNDITSIPESKTDIHNKKNKMTTFTKIGIILGITILFTVAAIICECVIENKIKICPINNITEYVRVDD